MEAFKIGFPFLRLSVLQSKTALLVCFVPFLLILYLTLPPLESSLMPTICHALHDGVLEGRAFAFFLLNCVTVTIIASSKLGSEEKGHDKDGQGQLVSRVVENLGDEKDDDFAVGRPGLNLDTPLEDGHAKGDDAPESVSLSPILHLDTQLMQDGGHEKGDNVAERIAGLSHAPLTNGPNLHKLKLGENFLRRSSSLNVSFDVKKPKSNQYVRESETNIVRSTAKLASRRDGKVRLHPNKPFSSDLKKTTPINSSHAAVDSESTRREKSIQKINNSRRPQKAQNPAPPSMDEVWASITSSKIGGDRMQKKEQSRKPNFKTIKQPQQDDAATDTPTQAAAAASSRTLLTSAAANASYLKAAKAAPNLAAKSAAAAAEKRVKGGSAEENGGDVEKLNRRAEEFIGRFNYQMRLQREESSQRRKGGCLPRNYYNVPHDPHSVHRPARGLLVG